MNLFGICDAHAFRLINSKHIFNKHSVGIEFFTISLYVCIFKDFSHCLSEKWNFHLLDQIITDRVRFIFNLRLVNLSYIAKLCRHTKISKWRKRKCMNSFNPCSLNKWTFQVRISYCYPKHHINPTLPNLTRNSKLCQLIKSSSIICSLNSHEVTLYPLKPGFTNSWKYSFRVLEAKTSCQKN